MTRITNNLVRAFFGKYLDGAPAPLLDGSCSDYPELTYGPARPDTFTPRRRDSPRRSQSSAAAGSFHAGVRFEMPRRDRPSCYTPGEPQHNPAGQSTR
jgi:hypothetical protein